MSSESITVIVTVIATVLIAATAIVTFFYKMLSDVKKEMKEETSRIWKSIDELSVRVNQLSNEVIQIKAILGNAGFVVKESEVSYKGDQGATGSKKSG